MPSSKKRDSSKRKNRSRDSTPERPNKRFRNTSRKNQKGKETTKRPSKNKEIYGEPSTSSQQRTSIDKLERKRKSDTHIADQEPKNKRIRSIKSHDSSSENYSKNTKGDKKIKEITQRMDKAAIKAEDSLMFEEQKQTKTEEESNYVKTSCLLSDSLKSDESSDSISKGKTIKERTGLRGPCIGSCESVKMVDWEYRNHLNMKMEDIEESRKPSRNMLAGVVLTHWNIILEPNNDLGENPAEKLMAMFNDTGGFSPPIPPTTIHSEKFDIEKVISYGTQEKQSYGFTDEVVVLL